MINKMKEPMSVRHKRLAKEKEKKENLQEVSKKLLGGYLKKAVYDFNKDDTRDDSRGDFPAARFNKKGDVVAHQSLRKLAKKREKGIHKAIDKLSGEKEKKLEEARSTRQQKIDYHLSNIKFLKNRAKAFATGGPSQDPGRDADEHGRANDSWDLQHSIDMLNKLKYKGRKAIRQKAKKKNP